MSYRITNTEDLDQWPASVQRQLRHLMDSEAQPAAAKPKPKGRTNRPEEDAGRMLVAWIDMLTLPNGLRPGLFFMHTPNGLARTAAQGGIFKAQGLRAGWPDYSLDLPLGPYHGLRLELKAEGGAKPTEDQLAILARLESVGFKCCVAWGFEDARRQIKQYLDFAG